jgi:hypothetical protein
MTSARADIRAVSETFNSPRASAFTFVSMSSSPIFTRTRGASNLRTLMNVGPAMERDLHALGIRTIEQLAQHEPDALFRRLQEHVGRACDLCVHDTFSAIVHEARTGEKTPWFAWTAARKRRIAAGELDLGMRS